MLSFFDDEATLKARTEGDDNSRGTVDEQDEDNELKD